MKPWIGLVIILAAGAGWAADTYQWVDEKGVVSYGEKPPAGRPARLVDTQPRGTIESGDLRQMRREAELKRRAGPQPAYPYAVAAPAPVPAVAPVRGMDFDIYIRLQRGMTEGELLMRAGRPDYETVDNLVDLVKTYYYLPTIANPFTTVVKLNGGRIAFMDRVKKF